MGRRHDTISFLSDYGTRDESVGVIHAVVRDLAPHVTVVDLAHDLAPFDVRGASLSLARAISFVPEGVVLAIVDPDVGMARRAIAIEVAGGSGVLVGPDNGLLAPAVAMAGGTDRAVVLDRPEHHLPSPGATSAGRDVFAAVAAALCNGVDLADLGTPVEAEALTPGLVPLPRPDGDHVVAEVLWVDRFGNAQLNLGPDDLATVATARGQRFRVSVGDLVGDPVVRVVELVGTYGEVSTGAVGAVVDAHGMISLVLDRRSASDELGLRAGDQVLVSPLKDQQAGGTAAVSHTSPVVLRPGPASHLDR